MRYPTRCYPIPPLTSLLCLCRNAQSHYETLGAVSMGQLLDHLRPRVTDYTAPLVAGLRTPSLTLAIHVEEVLVTVGASLADCAAETDAGFYAWVSVITTRTVLANHAAYRRMWKPRVAPVRECPADDASLPRTAVGRGRAA